uniref:Polycystin cation channel PKD1/PKD2 domain-containing protein n=1 Tax=Acrobeloides nanus TaxID=290746 RepID=A0A914BW58_9BILA
MQDGLYFFGEDSRTCMEWVHIVDAAKFVILFDIAKLALETTLFSYKVGTFDAFSVTHLSWASLGVVFAIIGFVRKRYYFFWPFLLLKITEVIIAVFGLALLFVLGISGSVGRSFLKKMLKWKYRKIEDSDAIGFTLILFLVLLLLMFVNLYVLDIVYRAQAYFRKRAMAIYLQERKRVLTYIT